MSQASSSSNGRISSCPAATAHAVVLAGSLARGRTTCYAHRMSSRCVLAIDLSTPRGHIAVLRNGAVAYEQDPPATARTTPFSAPLAQALDIAGADLEKLIIGHRSRQLHRRAHQHRRRARCGHVPPSATRRALQPGDLEMMKPTTLSRVTQDGANSTRTSLPWFVDRRHHPARR